jgi:hypothetical protein
MVVEVVDTSFGIAPNGRQLTEGGFLANLVDAAFC